MYRLSIDESDIYQNIEQFFQQNRKKSIPSLIFVIDLFACQFWRRFTVSVSCSKSIKCNLIINLFAKLYGDGQ